MMRTCWHLNTCLNALIYPCFRYQMLFHLLLLFPLMKYWCVPPFTVDLMRHKLFTLIIDHISGENISKQMIYVECTLTEKQFRTDWPPSAPYIFAQHLENVIKYHVSSFWFDSSFDIFDKKFRFMKFVILELKLSTDNKF